MTEARTRVKICGVSDPEHAHVAVEAGTDYVGLNFYPGSHRYVSDAQAAEVASAIRQSAVARDVKIVGLFVNEPVERIRETAEHIGLDIVQLSGDESPTILANLNLPAIGTVRASHEDKRRSIEHFEHWVDARPKPYAVIVDAHVPGIYGGTGTIGDWDVAGRLSRHYRTFLAGGLTPDNVAEAIHTVRPFAVDVSSGVESDRLKDPAKIRSFIENVRTADIVVRERA